ncbi:MAG TPA: hypothetical protein VIK84_04185, partial [Haloplasmataceae bacterium]
QLIVLLTMLFIIIVFKKDYQEIDSEITRYLQNNAKNTIELSIEDLTNHDAFIVSELHGFHENANIKYAFLTYLHQKKEVNVYLAEISFSSGYLINEYLHTGNEDLLKLVFSFYQGSSFYTKEEYHFYKKLYQYNQKVGKDKAISVYGIDIEHSLDSALYFYQYYTSNKVEINDILNKSYSDPLLNHLKKNIINYHEFYDTMDFQEREKYMYQNYLFLKDIYSINTFFSQLGVKHGYCDILSNNYQSFAYYLNHDEASTVKDRVLSLMTFYKASFILESLTYKEKIIYHKKILKSSYVHNDLDIFQEKFTLINLKQNNSPFSSELIWYDLTENNSDKVTTDYYQYIILIYNSLACEPLDYKNTISTYEIILKEIWP